MNLIPILNTRPVIVAIFLGAALSAAAATLRLDELDVSSMTAGWGQPQKNLSIAQHPLAIGGETFEHGVGTHADSEASIQLDGKATWFTAKVGVDDGAGKDVAAVEFMIFGDGRELWRSGVCRLNEKAREVHVKLDGVKSLKIFVVASGETNTCAHADWAGAKIEFSGAPPQMVKDEVMMTPPPPPAPRLNGPKNYGVRPGSPFLYRIPCTGERPITFRAIGLPEGLTLDAHTGIITGKVAKNGTVQVQLHAKNSHGQSEREFRIVVGNTLALTPPMGWNSWYICHDNLTEASVRQAADQMIASGMADFGYQYVGVDECWNVQPGSTNPDLSGPTRDADGRLLPNKRFPDIKGMVDHIHALGLKAGIYSSPGPLDCGGFAGSWEHEVLDAKTFADWGFDLLKYDLCSYAFIAQGGDPKAKNIPFYVLNAKYSLAAAKLPYELMWRELQKQDRDMVFNLCQYGDCEVWKWGGEMGNFWRTTFDVGLLNGDAYGDGHLPGFYAAGITNAALSEYARPGGWNDPDNIRIGWLSTGRTSLTPHEQYSYMSMWSLMAAPLIFGGDMAKLDDFTLNVLCNAEVIDVDQDPLGKQAKVVRLNRDELVLVKQMEDGSRAVGLFNLSSFPRNISIAWPDLGIHKSQQLRDLWRQKDIGVFDRKFESEVPRHGVMLFRLFEKN